MARPPKPPAYLDELAAQQWKAKAKQLAERDDLRAKLDEAVEAALEGMGCLQTTPVRKLSTVNSDG